MGDLYRYMLCGGFFLTASATCACANERWQWGVAGFFGHEENAAAKVQLIYAPGGILHEEGFRLRYEGRLSGWSDAGPSAPRSYVIEGENSLYLGARFHNGSWRFQLYGGATVFADTQFGLDAQFGASAIAEALWLGNAGEFIGFELRGSTVETNWSASFVSGWPTGHENLKLGPEGGISGNVTGWNARLGLAATGLSLGNCDLALGVGVLIDDQDRLGPYASIWLSEKF